MRRYVRPGGTSECTGDEISAQASGMLIRRDKAPGSGMDGARFRAGEDHRLRQCTTPVRGEKERPVGGWRSITRPLFSLRDERLSSSH